VIINNMAPGLDWVPDSTTNTYELLKGFV